MQASFIVSSYINQSISTTLQNNTNLHKFKNKQTREQKFLLWCRGIFLQNQVSTYANRQTCTMQVKRYKFNLFTISDSKVKSFKALNQFLNSSMVKILKHLKFKIYADLCSSHMWGHAKKMKSISQQKWFNDELLDPLFLLLTDY